ncbi:MAG TPA: glycosyltransferase [Vicinamibacterales bacterium]|nr:glycosyltransferase [Vicinamibacterales bacterium]
MRVLLLSASFPPIGGMTPLMAARWVHHLVKCGHDVDVLTIKPSDRHPVYKFDRSAERFVPDSVRVHRAYAGPVHNFAHHIVSDGKGVAAVREMRNRGERVSLKQRAATYVRPLMFPDTRADCVPSVLYEGLRMIRAKKYDVLFSISPPDTDNLIAWALCKAGGLPWVVHQGDLWSFGPWTDHSGYPSWRRKLDRATEAYMLRRMDQVMVLTPEMRAMFLETFPDLDEDKFLMVTVGYDPHEYEAIAPEPSPTGKFRVLYTGIFFEGYRDPYTFFDAFAEFFRSHPDAELVVAGNVGDQYPRRVRDLGIAEAVTFLGFVNHDRVVALQRGASVLLLLTWVGGYGFPAKTFEYIGAKRPVLTIDYDGIDPAARCIRELNRGIVTDNDSAQIRNALEQLYSMWRNNQLHDRFSLGDVPHLTWDAMGAKVEAALYRAAEVRRN